MNDITISSNRIKKELITLFICFLIAYSCNIGAIIYYESPFYELVTSLLYVMIFSVLLYVVWSFIRIAKGVFVKFLKK